MSRVSAVLPIFDPNRLELARMAKGLKKRDLADALKISPSAITQYETGEIKPSATTLAELALVLGMPVEFFAAGRPLNGLNETPHFRRLRSTTKTERSKAFSQAVLAWDVAQALEQKITLPPVDIPSMSASDNASRDEIEQIAMRVRTAWGLPSGPVPNVVRLLEQHGAIATRLSGDSHRVDAFCVHFGARPVVVLFSDKDDAARSRMDAAHELGHLVMHHDVDPGDQLIEQQAKSFAASFLMPATEIGEQLRAMGNRINWKYLTDLKRAWGVSVRALLYRAHTLQLISDSTYRRGVIFMNQKWGSRGDPGELPAAEQPVMLRRALEKLERYGYDLDALSADVRLDPARVEEILGPPTKPVLTGDLLSEGGEEEMTNRNNRHVVPSKSGSGWDVKAPGATRASSHHDTQGAAAKAARQIVGNKGGGEVVTHGRNGRIRDSDTIAPGNDPFPPRDTK